MGNKTAIIIGAGPAGLTAAYELLRKTDVHPVIIEEETFIGGISRTVTYNDNRIDIGGHRFFSKNQQIVDLWQKIMPMQGAPSKDDILLSRDKPLAEKGPDPEKEDRVMLIRDRVSRIFYLHKFFDYPISLKPATFINMGFTNTMKAGFSYIFSAVKKREEKSLEDFYINRFGKALYQMFFEDYTEKLWGVHPSNIAPNWGAQRVKGLSLSKAILSVLLQPFKNNKSKVETSLIEQFSYPQKGPGQLWETMADEIIAMGGEIKLNNKVISLNAENNHISSVVAEEKSGKQIMLQGDYIISSMPIKDLIESFNTGVSSDIRRIASQLPYRDFITVGLLLNKLKIKNLTKMKTVSNIVPDCWIYMQEREVKIGRLQIFNNWSPYMVKDIENTVWIGLEYFCSEGDQMWNSADEDFIKFAIDELVKVKVIDENDVLDSVRIKVKKACPAYFGTYSEFDKVREYLDTYYNLYCVGRNGQHRYNNMDHSMLTSIEAVNAIQTNSISKKSIWNVNTEEEYHEEKRKAKEI